MVCHVACKLRFAHKLRLVFLGQEYEAGVSVFPEGSGSSMRLPGCGVRPVGAGSLFSSVAPALRHTTFEQGTGSYSAPL